MYVINVETRPPPQSLLPRPNNLSPSMVAAKGSRFHDFVGLTVSICALSKRVGFLSLKSLFFDKILLPILSNNKPYFPNVFAMKSDACSSLRLVEGISIRLFNMLTASDV